MVSNRCPAANSVMILAQVSGVVRIGWPPGPVRGRLAVEGVSVMVPTSWMARRMPAGSRPAARAAASMRSCAPGLAS
jgi:hypothetical protein